MFPSECCPTKENVMIAFSALPFRRRSHALKARGLSTLYTNFNARCGATATTFSSSFLKVN